MQCILPKLPLELLESIIHYIPNKEDRRALWRVSRIFRELLTTRIFETLTIRPDEYALARLGAKPYDSLDTNRPLECLKLIRHLHLKAPFHYMLQQQERCPHYSYRLREYGYWVPYPDDIPKASFTPLFKLVPLLLQMQEKSLVSFSWDLGTCIPENILGSEGYLTKKQTAIESLLLITNGECYYLGRMQEEIVILSNFPRLRKFSWKGLSSTEEFNSLRGLFRSNFRVLEELVLDFLYWPIVSIDGVMMCMIDDEDRPSFTEAILPHKTNGVVQRFKSLKRLSLSDFEFDETIEQITRAFNIRNLQSLTLRNCEGILTFLSTIVDAGLVLRLKSLELMMKDGAIERNGSLKSPLISFLQSFKGLEHFHLMLRTAKWEPEHWSSYYWNAILHHSSTLKRLIYHERCKKAVPIADTEEAWSDPRSGMNVWSDNELTRLKSTSLSDAEMAHFQENHFYNSGLAQMQLECFGVADDIHAVLDIMKTPMAVQQDFKLLHFRRTGTDYLESEEWYELLIGNIVEHNPGSWLRDDFEEQYARLRSNKVFKVARIIFESPKFVNLQILAFGDFSHGGRYKGSNLILCRAATSHPEVHFRVMSRDDIDFYKQSGLLDIDFLAACPKDNVLGTWDNER